MKTLSTQLSIIAAILLLFTTACKKDKAAATQTLQGIWTEDPMGMSVARTITFGKDSVYYVIQNRALYIKPLIHKGAYQVRGNRLITRFSADNFGRISIIPYEFSPVPGDAGMYEMFANGTFRVVDGRLIIQHTGYANRKPEPTTTIYRLNPRD